MRFMYSVVLKQLGASVAPGTPLPFIVCPRGQDPREPDSLFEVPTTRILANVGPRGVSGAGELPPTVRSDQQNTSTWMFVSTGNNIRLVPMRGTGEACRGDACYGNGPAPISSSEACPLEDLEVTTPEKIILEYLFA